MANTIDLTESDINFLDIAYRRGFNHKNDDELPTGSSLMSETNRRSVFIRSHQLPECLKGKSLPPIHDFEKQLFYSDLKFNETHLNSYCTQSVCTGITRGGSCLNRSDPEVFIPILQLLCLENYMDLINQPLRLRLEKIRPTRRLYFVVKLLMDWHHGDECQTYISIATKLCLKLLELFWYRNGAIYGSSLDFCFMFADYIKVLQKNDCDAQILAYALEKFDGARNIEIMLPLLGTWNVKYVLETISKTGVKLKGILKPKKDINSLYKYHTSDTRSLIDLIGYGYFSVYDIPDWAVIKTSAMKRRTDMWNRHYHIRKLPEILSLKHGDYLLKLVWANIPDAFLTEDDFGLLLSKDQDGGKGETTESPPHSPHFNFLRAMVRAKLKRASFLAHRDFDDEENKTKYQEAWNSYKTLILNGEISEKSARSLKHLSRCVIRQILAMNSQLPQGVQFLELPKTIVNYLLLKDCGSNPYGEGDINEKLLWLYSDCPNTIKMLNDPV